MASTRSSHPLIVQQGWAIPEIVWLPVAGTLLISLPGLIGLATGLPLLFVSLGPTAYMQVAKPQQAASRFHQAVLGHFVGFGIGCGAVLLLGAENSPSTFSLQHLPAVRLWASMLAIFCSFLIASPIPTTFHPPGAATALLVTLGGFGPTWYDAVTVVIGVLVVAGVGELLRRFRVTQLGGNDTDQ